MIKKKIYKNKDKSGANRTLNVVLTPDDDQVIDDYIKLYNMRVPKKIKDYSDIPSLPKVYPSIEEFSNPIKYIMTLREQGYDKYGGVQIMSPKEWQPSCSFKDIPINTRVQVIQDLGKGKAFDNETNSYYPDEYEEYSRNFSSSYRYKPYNQIEKDFFKKNEDEFWGLVRNTNYKEHEKVEIEYAADLTSNRYKQVPVKCINGDRQTLENSLQNPDTHEFNLSNIYRANDSLFQILQKQSDLISGISSPWMYMGVLFAAFCWHVEDNFMQALNYMYKGEAKTWYLIPGSHKEAFDAYAKQQKQFLFQRNPNILNNLTLLLDPLDLIQANIPVYKAQQVPNSYILTFPKAYHAGFSHGFNVTEAVNIVTVDWLPYNLDAFQFYQSQNFSKKLIFPHQWIVCENVFNMNKFQLSKITQIQLSKEFIKVIKQEKEQNQLIEQFRGVNYKQQLFIKQNMEYDKIVCKICQNYNYLSFLQCSKCMNKFCSFHVDPICCLGNKIIHFQRFCAQDLDIMINEVQYQIELLVEQDH